MPSKLCHRCQTLSFHKSCTTVATMLHGTGITASYTRKKEILRSDIFTTRRHVCISIVSKLTYNSTCSLKFNWFPSLSFYIEQSQLVFFCIKDQSKKTMNSHQCELCLHILEISCRSSIRKLTCKLMVVYKISNPIGSSTKSTKAVNITSKSSLL